MAPEVLLPHTTLADSFDLPESVRDRVAHPDDPLDLVRALLDVARIPHTVDGDLIQAGELAVVVVSPTSGVVVDHEALNHAYLRVVASGAQRGLVLTMGWANPREIHRREMLAPQVLHVGPDGIQRMADAVALGVDPLRFAVAVPIEAL